MTELTRDEVNRYLHERIRGLCWHDFQLLAHPTYQCRCGVKCNYLALTVPQNPDYCSDDSPRSLLNEVVAAVRVGFPVKELAYIFVDNADLDCGSHTIGVITMTAEQIARACVEAWEARDENPELVK